MAIRNGFLEDLNQNHDRLIKEMGFLLSMTMEAAAYRKYVELNSAARDAGDDIQSRLYTILDALGRAVKRNRAEGLHSNRLHLTFFCVLNSVQAERCQLEAIMEPDDDGRPSIRFKMKSSH